MGNTSKKSRLPVTSVVTDVITARDIHEHYKAIADDNYQEIMRRSNIPRQNPQLEEAGQEIMEMHNQAYIPKRTRIDSAEEEEDYEDASSGPSGEDFSGNGEEGNDLISVKLNKEEMTLLQAIEALSKRHFIQDTRYPKLRLIPKRHHIFHHRKMTIKEEVPETPKQCHLVRRCFAPMTFKECAYPRCLNKIRQVRGLCFWLCRHQRKHCSNVCA